MNPNDPVPQAIPTQPEPCAAPNPAGESRSPGLLRGFVAPGILMAFLFAIVFLVLYSLPYLLFHWQVMDAQAEAESLYTKRKAELKAEAEHADHRLDLLDKRVHLTSLGFREVARKVLPNVVNIVNYREPTKKDLEFVDAGKLRLVYDPDDDRRYVHQGLGSGLIYKPGVILTNHHVLRDAKRLRITFMSGRSTGVDSAQAVVDTRTDLAVIRLPENLNAALKEESQNIAVFADSDKDVYVGDWTLAMGSPLDLRQTVTHGIISAKGRMLSMHDVDLVELIQTSAAIHPGNSGGPLFDQLGRVVGINVAIATDNGGNQGIGFAIPSNTATRICDLLLTKGEVPRGYLGITLEEVAGPPLKALQIDGGAIVVKGVVPGEAADKAGLKPDDIIVRVNKNSLSNWKTKRHFLQMIVDVEPGTEVLLDIIRADERMQVPVTVGKRPKNLP